MYITLSNSKIDYDIRTYRNHRRQEPPSDIKLKIAAGASVGTVLPMIFIARKQNVKFFNIKYGLKEMLMLSVGGIAGGLLTGLLADKKEHRKQKIHEGVFQFMNSVVPPVLTASLCSISKVCKKLDNIPYKLFATTTGLLGGMFLAGKLANKINDPYNKVPDRKITLKDSVANIDDAIGILVLSKVPIAGKLNIEKTLPAIYGWCGYRSGMSN